MLEEFSEYFRNLELEDPDSTCGTSDYDTSFDNDPDDCYCESDNNPSETEAFYKRWKEKEGVAALKQAKEIVKKIAKKVEEDEQPPCGNQNCQLCTWCVEAQFRDINALPRPVYSPRDPALAIKGETIVKDPKRISIQTGYDDMLDYLMEPVANVARFYCHVNWNNSTGGHEFIILKIGKQNFFIVDAQAGIVEPLSDTGNYFNDINFANSFICRLDNRDFNKELFEKYNDPKSVVPWDGRLDIPYMLEHGMLSEEEAEQYWKEHPDEAPNDRRFLSYEELDRMSESKNIFTSGDFRKYGKDVDLNHARGPITESAVMEFDLDSEKDLPSNVFTLNEYKKASSYRSLIVGEIHDLSMIDFYNKLLSERKPEFFISELVHEDRFLDQNDLKAALDMATDGEFKRGIPDYQDNYAIYKLAYDHGCKLIGCDLYSVKHYDRMNDEDADREAFMLKVLEEFENTNFVCQLGDHHLRSIPISKEFLDFCGDTTDDRGIVSDLTVDNASPIWTHFKNSKYVAILREPNELKNELEFTNQQHVQEVWNDIKNGVNPYSKKLWFHVSRSDKHEGKVFTPRVPSYLYNQEEFGKDDPYYEDMTIPRICFSPSIEGALHAIISMGDRIGTAGEEFYVYIPEKPINEYKHMTNKEIVDKKLVFDAKYTKECWITEPVKLILYGSIVIDQVYNHRSKPTANGKSNVGVVSYKWHWQTKPQVIKGTGHEAFAWNEEPKQKSKKKDESIKEEYNMSESFNYVQEGLFDLFKPKKQEPPKKYDPEAPWVDRTLKIDGKTLTEFEKEFSHNKNFDEIFSLYQDPKFIDAIKKFYLTNKPSMDQHYSSAFKRVARKIYSVADDDKFEAIRNGFVDGFFPPSRLRFVKYKNASGIVFCEAGAGGKDDIFIVSKDDGKVYYMDCGECNKVTESVVDFLRSFDDHFFDSYLKGQNKHVKEEYNMSNFVRDPNVIKMFLESEKDDDNEDTSTDITVTDVEIGADDGTGEQNQYDPEEVEYLNHLIAAEAEAISDYFEGGKKTKVPVLSKLYSDIGAEERFHLEQLIYAKSTITGEKYEPKDPDVRKEYEELLELGMDEQTAMTTAVDKLSISVKEEEPDSDMTDEEIDDIKESFELIYSVSQSTSLQTQIMLESVIDQKQIRRDIIESTNAFFEQVFIMEEVSNLNTKAGQNELGSKNPIVMILKAISGIYRLVISLVKKAKLAFQKTRLKSKAKWAWIKKHGIKGLFADGVSMYFYSDKKMKYDIGDALKYLKLINDTCDIIIRDTGIKNVDQNKYKIDKYIEKLKASTPDVDSFTINTLDEGISKLNGSNLFKVKMIVNDNNEKEIEEQFFGYTEKNFLAITKEGENSKQINLSNNIYNKMDIILNAFNLCTAKSVEIATGLNALSEKPNTIFQSNPKLFNKCVSALSVISKSLNKFTSAVSSDLASMMNLNKGLNELARRYEETHSREDKQKLGEYTKGRADAKQQAEEAGKNSNDTKSKYNV